MLKRGVHLAVALVLSSLMLGAAAQAADDHVVPMTELHQKIAAATQARQSNLSKVETFLSLKQVDAALRSAKLDGTKVQKAASLLSDEELRRLAARTERVRADVVGGALSNQELTYIVIALAAVVLVLLVVVAD